MLGIEVTSHPTSDLSSVLGRWEMFTGNEPRRVCHVDPPKWILGAIGNGPYQQITL